MGLAGGEGTQGKPLTALLRPEQVEIVENWDVVGLQGTGSNDLRVHGQFVPDEWTFIRGGEPTVDEPLYRYPSIAYAALAVIIFLHAVRSYQLGAPVTKGTESDGLMSVSPPSK